MSRRWCNVDTALPFSYRATHVEDFSITAQLPFVPIPLTEIIRKDNLGEATHPIISFGKVHINQSMF